VKHLKTYESHESASQFRVGRTDYEFDIDDIKYHVSFSDIRGSVNLCFATLNDEGEWDYRNLDRSNPFKTMKIITDIIMDFVENNPKVDKIEFFGSRDAYGTTPEWVVKLLSSNQYLYYLTTYLDNLLLMPRQWLSKPSRRTNMFSRWVDREIKDKNWSVKKIGNQIQLIKSKSKLENV
jgi:hypothetical protein